MPGSEGPDQRVETRIERAKARVEKALEKQNVPAAARAEAKQAVDGAAKEVRGAAQKTAADGVVTKEEAKQVRDVAKQGWERRAAGAMLAAMNASPAALALLMACLGQLVACRGREAPRDEPVAGAATATATLGAASSTGKEGTNMDYTFGIQEFATESYSFEHRGLVVSVHLHALFSTPALIPRYRDADPIFAWIYVRKPGQKELVYKLNAQLDAMMAKPFFLNHDEGWGGSSVPGSGRASLWTRGELDDAIKAFLDDPKRR